MKAIHCHPRCCSGYLAFSTDVSGAFCHSATSGAVVIDFLLDSNAVLGSNRQQ